MNKNIIRLEYDNDTAETKVIGFTEPNGDTYTIEGECIRCGQCCINRCNHLTVDDNNVYSCIIYGLRPALCAIFPGSVQDIIDNPKCAYKIRLIDK